MHALYNQALADQASGNITDLLRVSNAMQQLNNDIVEWMFDFIPAYIAVITSNIHGFYYNPSLQTDGFSALPGYLAALY